MTCVTGSAHAVALVAVHRNAELLGTTLSAVIAAVVTALPPPTLQRFRDFTSRDDNDKPLPTARRGQGTALARESSFFNSEVDYGQLPAPFNGINNNSWSFYSHGNTSDIRFCRDTGQGGDSFVLCKGKSIPQLPANSYLPTDAREPGRGWQDHISSHKFGSWC